MVPATGFGDARAQAVYYLLCGDVDTGADWAEKAIVERDDSMMYYLRFVVSKRLRASRPVAEDCPDAEPDRSWRGEEVTASGARPLWNDRGSHSVWEAAAAPLTYISVTDITVADSLEAAMRTMLLIAAAVAFGLTTAHAQQPPIFLENGY